MLEKDLISIVLPVYNGEKFISDSIKSCLAQTYSNIELIIVNDCSTDKTLEIIQSFKKKDNRVKLINNKTNLKLPASLNVGHKAANGLFLSWTSHDNLYKANAIEELLKAMKNNDTDLVYSDVDMIYSDGLFKREVLYKSKENILFGNQIGSCFLYRKEVFVRNQGYNEKLFLVEDYDFWLRASLHSKFYQLNKKLYRYRLHDNSLTNSISVNENKNKLFVKKTKRMFDDFSRSILEKDYLVISTFQTNILTHQKISFDWITNNLKTINRFIDKISEFQNFKNKKLVKKVFLESILSVYMYNSDRKFNFFRSVLIGINFYNVIDFNIAKTLIKYSFFKK
ncbi:glycosyltransferase [Lacinutrix sp. MedPE-SW]|uniref:glycosyltransferase family 2 protein n=1 Tax=Lacinutrix sp. MedPE-SW TaxID=1860087 RepID=UPI00091206B3|nr:glycosyltransferase [Lacinutrix sp. MedPE-SW]OIQ22723.1 MAG: hypothetical protein BM549_06490 [Lacinutrix sp. MedPE-SW]